jgi:hypothetical protein
MYIHTHTHTHTQTDKGWSRVLLDKMLVAQLLKNLPMFYGHV